MNKRFYGMASGSRMSLDSAASRQKTHWMSTHPAVQQNVKEKPTRPVMEVSECDGDSSPAPTASDCGGDNGCCPIDFEAIERKLKEQTNHD